MKYKGHIDLKRSLVGVTKLEIIAKTNDEPFKCHEYFYKKGDLEKHIDYINRKLSIHKYDSQGNRIELRTSRFNDNPNVLFPEGYKIFQYESGKLVKEWNYSISNQNENLEYEGVKLYLQNELVREEYHYPDQTYTVIHKYSRNKKITLYPEGDDVNEYYFNNAGFLIQFRDFKYAKMCKKIDYEYENGRLSKMIEYPHLKFKKRMFSDKLIFTEKGQFINQTEFFYGSEGLLMKEIKSDILNGVIIDELNYTYEK